MKAVEVRVTGRVQGVSFRAYAEEQARCLGVLGWVRNEPDGSVSAHLEGPAEDVDAMVAWCHEGPQWAQVEAVEVRAVEPTGCTAFEIRY